MTRIIEREPQSTVVQDTGSSGTTVMLITFVGLIVVAIAALLILHFTVGVA
ncbi:MAG TPA: hypothetical protein VG815_13415 [Chloroflexota bacterium]|jgi:hypothetical protein|nr:hypothetical protein [Chloroflexota bacterium]